MKVLLITFFLLFSFINSFAQDFKVVLADYKPYSWLDKTNNQVRGIEIDILKEIIEKRLNIPLHIEILPWKRAQLHVEQGKADAFISCTYSEKAFLYNY